MPTDLYIARCRQAYEFLQLEAEVMAKRNKKRAKAMYHFADALVFSATVGGPRPALKATSPSPHYLAGWNMAYGLTYPFLQDAQP